VRWSNIATVDNCFYFSGPYTGRDEQLQGVAEIAIADTHVRLHLAGALFEGTIDGDAVDLARKTTHEHEGTWTVTETITGTYRDDELRATYRYEECGPNEPCPGRCTLSADLVTSIARPRR